MQSCGDHVLIRRRPRVKWTGFSEATAYSHGLTDEQCREWDKLLRAKGLIPFIVYPNLCVKCGALWPEMFYVPDEEWERYIEPQMRKEMLCEACYAQIKGWIEMECK